MANGVVVVDRLNAIEASLHRALQGVKDELKNRDEYTEYNDTYLSKLTYIRSQAEKLEDQIRVDLNYA